MRKIYTLVTLGFVLLVAVVKPLLNFTTKEIMMKLFSWL